jgi:hypothetical protein
MDELNPAGCVICVNSAHDPPYVVWSQYIYSIHHHTGGIKENEHKPLQICYMHPTDEYKAILILSLMILSP